MTRAPRSPPLPAGLASPRRPAAVQLWTSCPGPVKAGSYCALMRRWASGDGVSLRLPMRWRLQSLAENRAQHQGLKVGEWLGVWGMGVCDGGVRWGCAVGVTYGKGTGAGRAVLGVCGASMRWE